MTALVLSGLDAQNPLAFFASLGLLRILDDYALKRGEERPRLSFIDEGRQTPKLWTRMSMDEIVGILLDDAAAQGSSAALRLAYSEAGDGVPPEVPGATRDLKPLPTLARATLDAVATGDRRTADLIAGFFSELVKDNNGNTKPTALHFTSQQDNSPSWRWSMSCGKGSGRRTSTKHW